MDRQRNLGNFCMRYVSGVISAIFLGLLAMHVVVHPTSHILCSAILALGAALALTTLKRDMPRMLVRLLAVSTVAVMFVFFFGFFQMVPAFDGSWYRNELALEAVSQLVAAFAMIPVLASYSCRLKAGGCAEQPKASKSSRAAFFSVPS
jgi:hypothetical protein